MFHVDGADGTRGPAGLRGYDPDPKGGGGDGPRPRGRRNISAQSNDTGGRADRYPTAGPDSDPWTRCRDRTVTSQHPGPGGDKYSDTGSCGSHPGSNAGTRDA